GDDVTEDEKDERLARLFAQLERQQTAHLESLVGARTTVLVEGPAKGVAGRFSGRSERHEIVHLDAPAGVDPTGHLVEVRVDEAYKHSLRGTMTSPPEPTMVPRRTGRVALPMASEGAR